VRIPGIVCRFEIDGTHSEVFIVVNFAEKLVLRKGMEVRDMDNG
jgi:ATP-dependent phosphoenolpyruvate carboxykinase